MVIRGIIYHKMVQEERPFGKKDTVQARFQRYSCRQEKENVKDTKIMTKNQVVKQEKASHLKRTK